MKLPLRTPLSDATVNNNAPRLQAAHAEWSQLRAPRKAAFWASGVSVAWGLASRLLYGILPVSDSNLQGGKDHGEA